MAGRTGVTWSVRSAALTVVAALVVVTAGCAGEPDVVTQDAAPIADGGPSGGPVVDLDPGAAVPADPAVTIGTLANGLTYYIRENDRPGGRAELRLVVNAGSANEEPDQSGVAHFLEHMLFNGTEQFPENELIDVLRGFGAEFGADINAYTSYDETVYQLTVATDDDDVVTTGLDVLSQWLSAATLDPTAVEEERGVVLDEWRGSDQTAQGRLFDAIERLFLTGTGYEGRDPIGTSDAIESMVPEPLRRFYDQWYRPDNAALIVVGDIDVDDIEAAIAERFESLTPRAQPAAEPDLTIGADTEPAVEVHADPDQPAAFVEVTLPVPVAPRGTTGAWRDEVLDGVAFDAIADRLASDLGAGGTAFTAVSVDSNSHVRGLDAPSVLAETLPAGVPDTLQAMLDEMERVVRYGFGANEISRLVSQRRTAAESAHEARSTVQDVDYAERYVANFLTGEPIPDATTELGVLTDILDGITPDLVAERFRARWTATAPHVLVVGPADEPLVEPADVLATVAALGDRELEPRDEEASVASELMARPEPIVESSAEPMTEAPWAFLEPTRLVFPNGATVIYNVTDITDGDVAFAGRSPGGSSLVADADVMDAILAGEVVTSSGVGDLGPVALDRFLADVDVEVSGAIGPYTEDLSGRASTPDLETLFQLVHLLMTQPRVDQVALDNVASTYRPLVEDPASDPGVAASVALYEERYGDERRLQYIPSAEDFATLDAVGVERVWRDRFGDASDWVFAFSGDFDEDDLIDLARRYVGTLPTTGRDEQWVDVESPPPDGIVERTVEAGTGAQGALNVLYTVPVASIEPLDVAAAAVVTQLLTTRLTDDIREALGESYSPFAGVAIYGDPEPVVETYVSVTGAPDRIGSISGFVQDDIGALRADGPSDAEFETAVGQVQRDIELFSDAQLIEEILTAEVDGVAELEDFADQGLALEQLTIDDVREFVVAYLPADRYIEITVLPR
ncbi:MAG TPA: insulinase family protein [Ilumatobacteraceae bacterium]|nr:insulinase family protein [Ilumatobacteraceae bacterium]